MLAIYLSPIYFAIQYWICRRWYKLVASYNIKNKHLDFYLKHFSWSQFILTLMIPLGLILPESWALKRVCAVIGAYWLGISLYFILFAAIIELCRWVYKKKNPDKYNDCKARTFCVCLIVILTAAVSVYGIINAKIVRTTEYTIEVAKDGGKFGDEMTVALFADPQFGYNIGVKHMEQCVDIINSHDVDFVAIAGDLFDNQYSAIKEPDKLIELFNEIKTKYGVYGVLGNHDVEEPILAGFTFHDKDISKKVASPEMLEFIDKANIKLLYDEYVKINDSVILYGRADYERPNLGNTTRKSAEEISKEVDTSLPFIILDHEPREYEELEAINTDLMLAGHTHDGQLWPTKIITDIVWENSYGLYQKNNFSAITTSGLGLFGPNMRVGTIAEVVIIHVKFTR